MSARRVAADHSVDWDDAGWWKRGGAMDEMSFIVVLAAAGGVAHLVCADAVSGLHAQAARFHFHSELSGRFSG